MTSLSTHQSLPRHDILILGNPSFQQRLLSIEAVIKSRQNIIDTHKRRVKLLEQSDNQVHKQGLTTLLRSWVRWKKSRRDSLPSTVKLPQSGLLSSAVPWVTSSFHPPIIFGAAPKNYTQDIAVIKIDPSKLNPECPLSNVIDLTSKYPSDKIEAMIRAGGHNFEFPDDGLLRLQQTTMSDNELRRQPHVVLKYGRASGITGGRANNIMSYARRGSQVSKEWAILAFDKNSGAFSEPGDSGAVVVDGAGSIGGILTAGAGTTDSIDVTYATPVSFVMEVIKSSGMLADARIMPG